MPQYANTETVKSEYKCPETFWLPVNYGNEKTKRRRGPGPVGRNRPFEISKFLLRPAKDLASELSSPPLHPIKTDRARTWFCLFCFVSLSNPRKGTPSALQSKP